MYEDNTYKPIAIFRTKNKETGRLRKTSIRESMKWARLYNKYRKEI